MVHRKLGTKKIIGLVIAGIIVLLVVGGLVLRGRSSNSKNNSSSSSSSSSSKGQNPPPSSQTATAAIIKTPDFNYQKPTSWAVITKDHLDSVGAVTGIGRPPGLSATFTVKVSDSVPLDNNDLKNSTLRELGKLSNFTLQSSSSIKVGGKTGQKFIYTSGDKTKAKQELDVVVAKNKTFFFLFSSPASDFDKYNADFAQILSSITFN